MNLLSIDNGFIPHRNYVNDPKTRIMEIFICPFVRHGLFAKGETLPVSGSRWTY